MNATETSTTGGERSGWRLRLERLRLRFRDRALESAYRADRFNHDLGNIRFAFLAGIALWVTWGVLLRPRMLALSDQQLDLLMRFGVFIPMLVVGFGLTFTRFFGRVWEWASVVIAGATLVFWVFYVSRISTLPLEYGYVGVILITAFTYTLLQLRFVLVVLVTVIGIATYLPYAFTAPSNDPVRLVLTVLYLLSFGMLGGLAAYRMERFTRQLFLRERQLDQERTRSDGLLLNMLPGAIVEQLKRAASGVRIAQSFDHVSVFLRTRSDPRNRLRGRPRKRSPMPWMRSSAVSTRSPRGTASRRSRRSETRIWPSPAPRPRCLITPPRPWRWRSISSTTPGRSGGRRATRSWSGVGSPRGRPSPE